MLDKLGKWRYPIALLASAFVGAAAATTPLVLTYSVVPNGQTLLGFDYTFRLTLDGSWVPEQSFDLIIFGDQAGIGGVSPLNDFSLTSTLPAVFPFEVDLASGTHNGPSLQDFTEPLTGWVPTGAGDSLSWTGRSSTLLVGPGELLFSYVVDRVQLAEGVPAILVPEPSTYLLLLAGLAVIAGVARQRATQPAPC